MNSATSDHPPTSEPSNGERLGRKASKTGRWEEANLANDPVFVVNTLCARSQDEKRASCYCENSGTTAYRGDSRKDSLAGIKQRHILAIQRSMTDCNRQRVGEG